ncbi:MAG: RNA pseudouridine synthase, partial [Bacteroides sp.]|nr:RNA pseudouridine synthase [Bacteroides sp.]
MSEEISAIELPELTDASGNPLYEHFRFVADRGQELLRVDKFVVARLQKSSRNR